MTQIQENKNNKQKWNLYEILWILITIGIATFIKLKTKKGILDLTVLISGVFCVILAAKGNYWNFIFSIYLAIGHAYISFKNGHYGQMATFIAILIPIDIFSMVKWKQNTKSNAVEMKRLNIKKSITIMISGLLLTSILGNVLRAFKNQNEPFLDASTIVSSITSVILRFLRYREQWIACFALNIFEGLKWGARFKSQSQEAPIMITLRIAYIVNSVYAFYIWSKGSAENDKKQK